MDQSIFLKEDALQATMLADWEHFRLRRSIIDEKEGGDMPIELNHMPTDRTMPWPVLSAPRPAGRREGAL